LLLLADAFSTKLEGEYADLWAKIAIASKNGDSSSLYEPIGHEVKSPTLAGVSSQTLC